MLPVCSCGRRCLVGLQAWSITFCSKTRVRQLNKKPLKTAFGFVRVLISFTEFCRNHSGLGVACNLDCEVLRSACLCVCIPARVSQKRIQVQHVSAHIACGSVLFRQHCNTLCTSLLPLLWMTSLHILVMHRRQEQGVYSK